MSLFVCVDDEHRVKVGEPVAAGKQVIVSLNKTFSFGDHDCAPSGVLMVLEHPHQGRREIFNFILQ